MRVLVTGATGFVGRRLVAHLASLPGYTVRAAVRTSAPVAGAHEMVAIPGLSATTDWAEALAGVDAVVHLAARVHVMRETVGDPYAAFRAVNVDGTMALASQAAAAGVRRFVYVSSIKVNGEATEPGHPFTEADSPCPLDPYGVSKLEAETALRALGSSVPLEVAIIRPPLVYGPGVKANFRQLVKWVARGVPLPLGAVTANRRSLIAVDNLVDLVETCIRHPAAAGEVFLASDGEDVSTAELLRRIADALGRRAWLVPVPVGVMQRIASLAGRRDVIQRLTGSLQVDSSKARRVVGWSPPRTLDEGLRIAAAEIARN